MIKNQQWSIAITLDYQKAVPGSDEDLMATPFATYIRNGFGISQANMAVTVSSPESTPSCETIPKQPSVGMVHPSVLWDSTGWYTLNCYSSGMANFVGMWTTIDFLLDYDPAHTSCNASGARSKDRSVDDQISEVWPAKEMDWSRNSHEKWLHCVEVWTRFGERSKCCDPAIVEIVPHQIMFGVGRHHSLSDVHTSFSLPSWWRDVWRVANSTRDLHLVLMMNLCFIRVDFKFYE